MYDLHCHILPGIDDGPADWSGSLAIARALVAEGVTCVAATPHGPGSSQSRIYLPSRLRDLVVQLREYLQRAKLGLQVVLGTEMVVASDLTERLRQGDLLGYGTSRPVLLETPAHIVIEHLQRSIFDLQLAGHRVILAHPERTRVFQDNPNLLIPLIERGVVVQITAASLVGWHGQRLQDITTQMVYHNLAQIIASDAHAPTGARAPAMREAFQVATQLVGEHRARRMVEELPHLLLSDAQIPLAEPYFIQPQKQRWWRRR